MDTSLELEEVGKVSELYVKELGVYVEVKDRLLEGV